MRITYDLLTLKRAQALEQQAAVRRATFSPGGEFKALAPSLIWEIKPVMFRRPRRHILRKGNWQTDPTLPQGIHRKRIGRQRCSARRDQRTAPASAKFSVARKLTSRTAPVVAPCRRRVELQGGVGKDESSHSTCPRGCSYGYRVALRRLRPATTLTQLNGPEPRSRKATRFWGIMCRDLCRESNSGLWTSYDDPA